MTCEANVPALVACLPSATFFAVQGLVGATGFHADPGPGASARGLGGIRSAFQRVAKIGVGLCG